MHKNELRTKISIDENDNVSYVVETTYDNVHPFKRGDIVTVTDGSYNKDAETGEKRYGINRLFKDYKATVIKTRCEQFYIFDIGGNFRITVRLDLLLQFPTGEHVFCSSICVKFISSPPPPPTNALSALHAIALKKGFPVETIMGVNWVKDNVWNYWITDNNTTFQIDLNPQP